MISPLRTCGLLVLLILLTSSWAQGASSYSALSVVEGTVIEVGSLPGEGGLELVTVRLASELSGSGEVDLLLAPQSTLEEAGFSVQDGDRLKARVFSEDQGPVRVHKVRNLSQDSMVRLRTLRQIPLWNGAGAWQGSPGIGRGQRHQSVHGQGQRGGAGPPR